MIIKILSPAKPFLNENHDSNRRQAAKFAENIIKKGYSIEPLMDWNEPLTWFTDKEVKTLAIEEHESSAEGKTRTRIYPWS